MSKFLAIILACIMLLSLAACQPTAPQIVDPMKVQVVCTTFPVYDWARSIATENVDVVLLENSGVDLHSYQPTAEDIMTVQGCDIFVYVGGESDEWVEDLKATSPNVMFVRLMDSVSDDVVLEEAVEGMQETEEEEEEEYDEHIWLSVRCAQKCVAAIAEAMASKVGNPAISQNAEAYLYQLRTLDSLYTQMVVNATNTTLVFADRFPFRYLMEDYNLEYYAAFSGCSAETEASFETVAFLADKVATCNLSYILILEGSDQSLSNTIINSMTADVPSILTLNSMQTVLDPDNTSYLEIVESNYEALSKALGCEEAAHVTTIMP